MVLLKRGKGGKEIRAGPGWDHIVGVLDAKLRNLDFNLDTRTRNGSCSWPRSSFLPLRHPSSSVYPPRVSCNAITLCGLTSVPSPAKVKDLAKSVEKFSFSFVCISPLYLVWSIPVSCWHSLSFVALATTFLSSPSAPDSSQSLLCASSPTFLSHIPWGPMGPSCDPSCSPRVISNTGMALMPTVTCVYNLGTACMQL